MNLGDYPDFVDQPGADQRACLGKDTDLFFPEPGDSAETAKAICRGCPLLDACKQWVLAQPQGKVVGVWGGLSDRDRRNINRGRRNRNPKQTCHHCGVFYGNFIRPHMLRVHADQPAVAA